MSKTPDVVPDEIIESKWGNEIRDRTWQVFVNIAERDTWTKAPEGAHCFTTEDRVAWRKTGGKWMPYPWGARATVTTSAVGGFGVPYPQGIKPGPNTAIVANVSSGDFGAAYIIQLIARNFTETEWQGQCFKNNQPFGNMALEVHYMCQPDWRF